MKSVRKGQMEILGIAIVIILVLTGFLFAIQWMAKPSRVEEVHRAKESVLAANFINTLLGTSTDCGSRPLRDVLQDCALTGGAEQCPDGKNSCDYAQVFIKDMLDKTFGVRKLRHHFFMTGTANVERLQFGTTPCPGEREQKTHAVPLGVGGLAINIALEICR